VYLHYVFDLWIETWRQKEATDVIVVRYADALVVGFENRMEAERFLEAFRERLAKFGLELHPEKDRLSVFGQRLRRLWWLILRRRSQRPAPWDRLIPIYTRWLPAPRVLHPYPTSPYRVH
jgi:Reverse transcriptase (RNA-dependent DNA polymerase)